MNILEVTYIKFHTAKVLLIIIKIVPILVNFNGVLNMEKEDFYGMMALIIMDNSKKIYFMAKVF